MTSQNDEVKRRRPREFAERRFTQGQQVIYVPSHVKVSDIKNPDCEVGFVLKDAGREDIVVVAYFEKFSWPILWEMPKLRSPQVTYRRDLVVMDVLPQDYVNKVIQEKFFNVKGDEA